MADIFISYAHKDRSRIQPIAQALQARGWEVWWDIESLRSGQSFNEGIQKALSEAKCVMVLWSNTSAGSKWVAAEAYWAWEHGKLASVFIDNQLELPVPFNTTHSENLSEWSGDTAALAFQKLVVDLANAVGAPSSNRSPEPSFDTPLPNRAPATIFRDELTVGAQGPEMVVIPSGTFLMGSSDRDGSEEKIDVSETPQHEVKIAQVFSMGRFPVTFEQYDLFCRTISRPFAKRKKLDDHRWGRGNRPVINACLEDALAYCEWLSAQTNKLYRLPTEAEWEYACRAGTTTRYYWGDEPGENCANFYGSGTEWSGTQTSPVGFFSPNPYGLCDMLGNVLEWVVDHASINYEEAPDNGAAWLLLDPYDGKVKPMGRVLRGGSWRFLPDRCRSASRLGRDPNWSDIDSGFRVLRAL